MQAADEDGVRIPEDISLMGFDNISFTALPRIGITTIEQPQLEMARAAFELITRSSEEENRQSISIEPRLVVRTSCRSV